MDARPADAPSTMKYISDEMNPDEYFRKDHVKPFMTGPVPMDEKGNVPEDTGWAYSQESDQWVHKTGRRDSDGNEIVDDRVPGSMVRAQKARMTPHPTST